MELNMKCIRFFLFVILIISFIMPAFAGNYQNTILALYKSSENQKEEENESFWYLSVPLKNMGFTVKYWDIDSKLPSAALLNEARAIVTWFRGESMDDPIVYMDMLDKFIDSGKKVLIIDNFGAYSNRKTKAYTDMGRLNITLSRLGIIYMGDWTQDASVLRFDLINSNMVENQAKQDIKDASFFYRFVAVDRDLKSYLSIARTDRDYSPSPVIVTNRNGGFALSRYIYRMENNKLKLLLNINEFLKEALFPASDIIRIGLLADNSDPKTASTLAYTIAALNRTKLPYEVILKDQIPQLLPGDLRKFSAVGLILLDDSKINGDVIKSFLADGGGLVSLYGGSFFTLAPYLSIEPPPQNKKFEFGMKGYKFNYGFLLGEGLTIDDSELKSISGYGIAAPNTEVWAYDYSNLRPILWYARKEKGQVITWNWDTFYYGEFQGAIIESFMRVLPVGMAGNPGLGIMFIDDWPLPMYNVIKEPLTIEDTEFYTNVWWPEITSLFEKNQMDYSCFLILNYNGNTTPPFTSTEFFVGKNSATVRMAQDVLKRGKELGFHGYNHISLTREKTNQNPYLWGSLDDMYESLRAAKRSWISLFGENTMPLSYVAPHNIISDEGIKAVHDVFPSIRVISTLESGKGDETHFEFGRYKKYPEIYMIPRTLSGYVFTNEHRQLLISGITGDGIWAHFIHPDDIFDPARSLGNNWVKLKADFQKMINFANHNYPWMRYKNTRDAYLELMEYDDNGVEFRWKNDTLKVQSKPGFQFRISTNDYDPKAVKFTGVKLVYAYKRMNALILQTTAQEAIIEFPVKKK